MVNGIAIMGLTLATRRGAPVRPSARLGASGSFFGDWTADRSVNVQCDSVDNPNSYRFCDQSVLGMPLRHEFKFGGSYTLPWYKIQLNAALQSYSGGVLGASWNIGRTTRYAADCISPCTPGALVVPNMTPTSITVALLPPGTSYYDRLNQLDFGVRKLFHIGRTELSGQMDLFNFLNSSFVKSQTTTIGSSYGKVNSILQPRTLRLALQMKF